MNRSISGQSALETVEKHFEAWRSRRANKREPIPRHLWQAATGLCREHSIARVSRELRLSYTDLKKKIGNDNCTSERFIEIDTTFAGGRWQIECERPDGSRLCMTGYGRRPEIDGLLRSFLS